MNLNSKEARTEYSFLSEETKNQRFVITKVNLNRTPKGTEKAKLFCQVVEGENQGKTATHEIYWTEKNAFRIRELALLCFPAEEKRDEKGEHYQYTHVEYPADFEGGQFVADFVRLNDDSEFKVLKNFKPVIL